MARGNLYFLSVTVFGMGTLFALDPVVSQAVGASASIRAPWGCGLVAGLAAVATLLLVRVRQRFGREIRRVVIDEDVPSPLPG